MYNEKKSLAMKAVAWILTLCLVITLIPDIGYAMEDYDTDSDARVSIEDVTENDIIEKTEITTTYDLGGSEKAVVIHGASVRFEDSEEKLIDYDPSLVDIIDEDSGQDFSLQGYAYTNQAGDMKHYIPEELSEDLPVRMEYKDYSIEFTLTNVTLKTMDAVREEVTIEESSVQTPHEDSVELPVDAVYGESNDSVEVKYTSISDSVKETLVLNEQPATNQFTYRLKLTGMTARKNVTDGGITYYDKETDEIVGFLSTPWMNDASGEAYSEDITYELEEVENREGEYIITMTVDEGYLNDESRKYPVMIDPTNT